MDISARFENSNPKARQREKLTMSKSSKALRQTSASRGEVSTTYSKNIFQSAKARGHMPYSNIDHSKKLARASIHHLNQSERIDASVYEDRSAHESVPEVASEVAINTSKNYMDDYYASNGYFSYSQNRAQMRNKDNYQDRLKTFVDEKLLEVAGQISVKKREEDKKNANIDRLQDLRGQIGKPFSS